MQDDAADTPRSGTAFASLDPTDLMRFSGIELLRAMIARRLPAPTIAKTMNFELVEVDDGVAIFEGEPGPHLLNPLGGVHGGWVLTLVDSAGGCAAHTTLPAGVGYTTIETKANFARPLSPDSGRIRAEGRVVARGRRIISTEIRVTNDSGKIVAHGTSTIMVFAPEG